MTRLTSSLASPRGPRPRRLDLLRGEEGFTLVELLVAILIGTVVTFASFALLEISLFQTSRITDRVSATQRSRVAMEKIVAELHSSCVAVSTVPIVKESKGESLQLISETGSEVSFANVDKHKISLSGGTLTDAAYESNGGIAPKWTFPSTPTSTRTLLTGVSATGSTPIFQYFKYENGALLTTPLTVPTAGLSEAEAKNTAAVTISFTTLPENGHTNKGRSVELSNTVLLRFDPASATGLNSPCT